MIALLFSLATAQADPLILRTPGGGHGATVGLRGFSAGIQSKGPLGFAIDAPWSGASLTTSAGVRFILAESPAGWTVQSGVSGGLILPTTALGFGLEFAPWVWGGLKGRRFVGGAGLAIPAAVGFVGQVQARLPVVGSLHLGGRLGESDKGQIWIDAQLRMGQAWTLPAATMIQFEPAVSVTWKP